MPVPADVVEGVRAAIAAYTHALDDGRVDDVVATFCPDGSFEMPGMPTAKGDEALRATYANFVSRRPQRHLVSNTLVSASDASGEVTAVSDVVLTVQGKDGTWPVVFVGRYHDVLHATDDGWLFHRRAVMPVGDA